MVKSSLVSLVSNVQHPSYDVQEIHKKQNINVQVPTFLKTMDRDEIMMNGMLSLRALK